MPPVPPLPSGNHEVYNEAGVNKWLGPQPVRVESMHNGGDLQGFWNSRRGGVQQVPDPKAERAQRLEQELKDLRKAWTMRQIQSQDPLGAYGAQPFQRMGPPTTQAWTGSMSMVVNPILNIKGIKRLEICVVVDIHVKQLAYLHRSRASMGASGGLHDGRPREEELKPVTITLPKLPDLGGQNPGLAAGDWLAQIRPQIADISARAMQWWDNLLDPTMQRYQQWLGSDPITRLNVQPPTVAEMPPGFMRLEQRVTSLLLQTLPKSLAMVANRQLGSAQIISKVLKTYQPDALGERQNTLQALTATQTASSSADASASLRLWERHYGRAGELGATLPDPTLMTGALDKIMSKLLQTNPQPTFRLNAFRMQAKADTSPSIETVQQLHQMLLAEVALGLGNCSDQSTKSPRTPAVKALQDKPAGSPAISQIACRFWKSSGDANKERFVAFNIPLMKMASTTDIPVGQLRTKSRIVHMLLLQKMARVNLRLEHLKVLQPEGVDPVVVEKALLEKVMAKEVLKGKVGRMPTKRTRTRRVTRSKDDQKFVKKVEADGGKERVK